MANEPGFFVNDPEQWKKDWPETDFENRIIELDEVDSGGIPKDGIPAINRPRFTSVKRAKKWLKPEEPVMAVIIENEARAYPVQILLYHQIINDKIKGKSVLVSFCPLCNNGLVLDRRVEGKKLTFGSTGLFRNSGMIMFDRQSGSWWQQFTGAGLIGDYAGMQLQTVFPTLMISFEQFRLRYPKGKVLSKDTGFNRDYGKNPFQGYDAIDNPPFLFNGTTDERLPPMERVVNIRLGQSQTLYPYRIFQENRVINDSVGTVPVVVASHSDYASPLDNLEIAGSRKIPAVVAFDRRVKDRVLTFRPAGDLIEDIETGSTWNVFGEAVEGQYKGEQLKRVDRGSHFAFAALAFAPNAKIYEATAGGDQSTKIE